MKIINVALSGLFVFLCFCVDARPRKKSSFDDNEAFKKNVEAFRQNNSAAKKQVKSKEIKQQIDPLESQCKKVYKNSYHESREQKKQQSFSKNGRVSISKNTTSVIGSSYVYSFKLIRKIDNNTGLFIPICESRSYTNNDQAKFTDEENTYIVIVNRDLSDYVDNDIIELKDNERLYSIGIYTSRRGRSFRKFTFNRNDVIKYLNRKKSNN